jgi:hypothetical protein
VCRRPGAGPAGIVGRRSHPGLPRRTSEPLSARRCHRPCRR